MGKRFPSIKLIEKMAIVLDIEAYRLFMDESGTQYGDLNEDDDFLLKIPPKARSKMIKRLSDVLNDCIKQTLIPQYELGTMYIFLTLYQVYHIIYSTYLTLCHCIRSP